MQTTYDMTKRIFDFSVALVLLVVLLPVLLIIAILVRVLMGAPILFKQSRPGLNEQSFALLKFRTMDSAVDVNGLAVSDAEAKGIDGKPITDASRLTNLGRVLRRLSLDELPQLFNVLSGDLSLVGPRPLLTQYLDRYNTRQRRRHEVLPGITGWAQVHGRNSIDWEEKFELDIWYVENRSFLLDLKILFLTFSKLIWSHDTAASDHVTMPPFTGSLRVESGELDRGHL